MRHSKIELSTSVDDLKEMEWTPWIRYAEATRIDDVVYRVRGIIGQDWPATADLYQASFHKVSDDLEGSENVAEIEDRGTASIPDFHYRYRRHATDIPGEW